jgi:hypothetical protein
MACLLYSGRLLWSVLAAPLQFGNKSRGRSLFSDTLAVLSALVRVWRLSPSPLSPRLPNRCQGWANRQPVSQSGRWGLAKIFPGVPSISHGATCNSHDHSTPPLLPPLRTMFFLEECPQSHTTTHHTTTYHTTTHHTTTQHTTTHHNTTHHNTTHHTTTQQHNTKQYINYNGHKRCPQTVRVYIKLS